MKEADIFYPVEFRQALMKETACGFVLKFKTFVPVYILSSFKILELVWEKIALLIGLHAQRGRSQGKGRLGKRVDQWEVCKCI